MENNEIFTVKHAVKFRSEVTGEEPMDFIASLTKYPTTLDIIYAAEEKPLGKFLLSKVGHVLKFGEDGFTMPTQNKFVTIFNRVLGMSLPDAKPVE